MARKVDYEIKTDKKGRTYANRIDLKTGKKKRVSVKVAKKRLRDIRYKENRREKEKELEKIGSNWNEYQKEKKRLKEREKEKKAIRKALKKAGKKRKKSKKQQKEKKEEELQKVGSNKKEYQKEKKEVKKQHKKEGKKKKKSKKQQEQEEERIEKEVMKNIGVRSRYRFWWKYWEMPNCGTPVFMSDAQAYDGDHYEKMKEYCEGIYQDVMASDLCPDISVEGGACIVLYRRKDKEVIKYHEIGEGCSKV